MAREIVPYSLQERSISLWHIAARRKAEKLANDLGDIHLGIKPHRREYPGDAGDLRFLHDIEEWHTRMDFLTSLALTLAAEVDQLERRLARKTGDDA